MALHLCLGLSWELSPLQPPSWPGRGQHLFKTKVRESQAWAPTQDSWWQQHRIAPRGAEGHTGHPLW